MLNKPPKRLIKQSEEKQMKLSFAVKLILTNPLRKYGECDATTIPMSAAYIKVIWTLKGINEKPFKAELNTPW